MIEQVNKCIKEFLIKGTDEYIYRLWGFSDGGFYKKVH